MKKMNSNVFDDVVVAEIMKFMYIDNAMNVMLVCKSFRDVFKCMYPDNQIVSANGIIHHRGIFTHTSGKKWYASYIGKNVLYGYKFGNTTRNGGYVSINIDRLTIDGKYLYNGYHGVQLLRRPNDYRHVYYMKDLFSDFRDINNEWLSKNNCNAEFMFDHVIIKTISKRCEIIGRGYKTCVSYYTIYDGMQYNTFTIDKSLIEHHANGYCGMNTALIYYQKNGNTRDHNKYLNYEYENDDRIEFNADSH